MCGGVKRATQPCRCPPPPPSSPPKPPPLHHQGTLLPNLICRSRSVGNASTSSLAPAAVPRNKSKAAPGGSRPCCCCLRGGAGGKGAVYHGCWMLRGRAGAGWAAARRRRNVAAWRVCSCLCAAPLAHQSTPPQPSPPTTLVPAPPAPSGGMAAPSKLPCSTHAPAARAASHGACLQCAREHTPMIL